MELCSNGEMVDRQQKRSKYLVSHGLPRWCSGKEFACQCRRGKRSRFNSWVRKIPMEKEMATHSRIPAWRISRISSSQRSLMGHNPWGHKESDMTE